MKYLIALLCSLVSAGVVAQKIQPTLNLSTGHTYYITCNDSLSVIRINAGVQNNVSICSSYQIAFDITGNTDTIYHAIAHYQKLGLKINLMDTTIDMSSIMSNKTDTPSVLIRAMMNKPFRVTLTKSGRIMSVRDIGKIADSALLIFPTMDSAKRNAIKSRFMQYFGEDAIKSGLERYTRIFPHHSIAKLDQWVINSRITEPAAADVKTSYELVGQTADDYHIHGDGTISTGAGAQPLIIDGRPAKYTLQGLTFADILINKKTCWPVEYKYKQIASGKIEISANSVMPGTVVIPVILKSETYITGK